jgi:hypothetical protein
MPSVRWQPLTDFCISCARPVEISPNREANISRAASTPYKTRIAACFGLKLFRTPFLRKIVRIPSKKYSSLHQKY